MDVKVVRDSALAVLLLGLGFLMSGCGIGGNDRMLVHCQSTFYGAQEVEKIDISVTTGGKVRWLGNGDHHEKILAPRDTRLLEGKIREAKVLEMEPQYGKAVADGGFRRIVVHLDGTSHEVVLFPGALGEGTSGKRKEDLKNFTKVWNHLVSLGVEEFCER